MGSIVWLGFSHTVRGTGTACESQSREDDGRQHSETGKADRDLIPDVRPDVGVRMTRELLLSDHGGNARRCYRNRCNSGNTDCLTSAKSSHPQPATPHGRPHKPDMIHPR